jgi:osmotically-inducible protein OsmY
MNFKNNNFLLVITVTLILAACGNRPQVEDENFTWAINDSTIETAIEKEYEVQPYVTPGNIQIDVENGIVTLFGETEHLIEKQKAAEIATMIRGVRGVVNLMEVEPVYVEDKILKQKIDDIFYLDPVLESYKINVQVDSGVVSLKGRVETWHEIQLASDLVKTIKGIRKVNNDLALIYYSERPKMAMIDEISSALDNDIRVQDGLIDVEVEGNVAILKGEVGSAAEKSLAIVHAHIPGIDSVNAEELRISLENRDPLMRKDKYVKKPDYQIVEAIQQTYLQDPRLFNHDIKVESVNGHVILTGSVDNLRAKKAAAQDASYVVGVWKVENNIQVEPVSYPVEKTVADNVRMAIEQHPFLNNYDIVVEEHFDGTITLKGNVNYSFEKQHAEEVASRYMGVIDIANNIEVTKGLELPYTITPETTNYPVLREPVLKNDAKIKEDVAYQLWWSPFVDRDQIDINVEDGKVTLSGTVNTALEMDYAVKNAYEGGAFSVVNKLEVDFWQL